MKKHIFYGSMLLTGNLERNGPNLEVGVKTQIISTDGQSPKSRKEFVTAYAYSKNPNEDWAESVAYYLFHPNALRSCSLAKYEFIDQAMHMYSEGGVPFKRLEHLEER